MKTFLFDSLNRFRKYSKELDTMAEIRKCLCGKAWQVFNNSGDKEVYIFQEDGRLIISINGIITKGSWEYLSVNNSIAISASNQEYMVHPAFLDNILFALQVDGTEHYAFLIDQQNAQNFAPRSLDDLHQYLRQKEQKRIEEENRRIEEEKRIREKQLRAEQKRIEKEKKEREERERREREQWEELQNKRLAKKIYEDEIIKSRLLCFLFYSDAFYAFFPYLLMLLVTCLSLAIILRVGLFWALTCWGWGVMLCYFLFYGLFKLILRCRLKKFIKNNRTYSTDMLYRLVEYNKTVGFKLSYNKFKKLILDQIPTNEIHYTTKDNKFLSFSLSGVQILSHLYYRELNLFIVMFDKDVTEIRECAFYDCSSLTSISIPPSVTKIGNKAFSGCSNLTSITIPPSVTEIGDEAFYDCSSLTSISIPPSVTKIGYDAFYGCSSLTSITIPPSVTEIGGCAFSDCSSLTSIIVSKDNKVYDSREDCNAIIRTKSNTLISGCKNTTIPSSVTEIGDWAFSDCSSLTSITIPSSVTEIGYEAFSGCSSLTSISIPESVTEIGLGAFSHCSNLTSITIPPSVTKIREFTFSGCKILTSISIPESVTEIGDCAFSGCSSLTSIIVSNDNKVYDSREDCNAIIHTESNTLIRGCENTIIPPSVTKIGDWAFSDCSSLTCISIPESVTEIENGAFSDCSSLTSITIPSSVTEIKGEFFLGTFSGCSSLTEVRIPKGCNVDKSAFKDCPNVEIIRY